MPAKRALIVDDSKTAQFKLKKTLKAYDLIVDTAISAEDALSYLSYQVPDVIFMDHSMNGMSGLDAVKIIKSNLATATIPVVMYTAQSGELYLSQARAIGAIEVLSKDVMSESDIQRVMSSLKVGMKSEDASDDKFDIRPRAEAQALSADLVKVRDQVANSLDIQQGQFRRELQDNTRLLVNRFMREIRGLRDEVERQKKLDRDLLAVNLQNYERRGFFDISPWWFGALGALSVALVWAIWGVNSIAEKNNRLLATQQELSASLAEQKQSFENQKQQLRKQANSGASRQSEKLLRALVWAINQKGQFQFDEPALGDSRMEMISGLLEHLSAANYNGTLTLDVHNGNFCVVLDQQGGLSLPAEALDLRDCQFLSSTAYNFDSASQTSLAFLNLIETYPIVERGDLSVQIRTHGLTRPAERYPEISNGLTSEQWNNIALTNNRLSISLQN